MGIDLPDEHTEAPRAYIVVAAGCTPCDSLANEIQTWLNPKVAHYKRLRGGIRFIDAVPKSQTGKILRRVLKDRAKQEVLEMKAKL